jgi:hypothetical protein
MSGVEIIGAMAAAGQLLSSVAHLIQLSVELRSTLRKGPRIFREKNAYLDSLIWVLDRIRHQRALQDLDVSRFIASLTHKVEGIKVTLLKYFEGDTDRLLGRFLGSIRAVKDRDKVCRFFDAIDREKTNLLLYISAVSNESIRQLASGGGAAVIMPNQARGMSLSLPNKSTGRIESFVSAHQIA